MKTHQGIRQRRESRSAAFSLIELLVVIGIIVLLITLSFVALGSSLRSAREWRTRSTIMKADALLRRRLENFQRFAKTTKLDQYVAQGRVNIPQQYRANRSDKDFSRLIAIKEITKVLFPQNYVEAKLKQQSDSAVIDTDVDRASSEILYYMLTKVQVPGATGMEEVQFDDSELTDTDGDGFLEVIDAWGTPLRFYRWPTYLLRPGVVDGSGSLTTGPSRTTALDTRFASMLMTDLPGMRTDGLSIGRDPDDTTDALRRWTVALSRESGGSSLASQMLQSFEDQYHTPLTYHEMLIVSAGPDKVFGILPAIDTTGRALALGRLGAPDWTTAGGSEVKMTQALSDNMTNHNLR